MKYAKPGSNGAKMKFESRYDNFIGGEFVKPAKGQYFENISPVTGKAFCEVARSSSDDIEKALDAAHSAKTKWGQTSPTERRALHHVRSHLRIRRGAVELVRPHWRGDPEHGVRLHRHVVTRAEDEPGAWKGGPLPAPRILHEMEDPDDASLEEEIPQAGPGPRFG